jgi:hypothetical protein
MDSLSGLSSETWLSLKARGVNNFHEGDLLTTRVCYGRSPPREGSMVSERFHSFDAGEEISAAPEKRDEDCRVRVADGLRRRPP